MYTPYGYIVSQVSFGILDSAHAIIIFMIQIRQRGFTIVELLIVIVIIGILASLVIVAYNGIQMRARNSQTVAAIQAYKKALLQYAIENQTYPTLSRACLGTDYPDTGVYTTAANRNCFRSNSTGLIDTTFNNAIRPYLGNSVPTPNNTVFGSGSSPWATRGSVYTTTGIILNGVANPWTLIYTLEGQTICPVSPVLDLSAYPNTTSTPPASGYSQLLSGGTIGVECWLAMPSPTSL